jgi:hypothetical protein
MLTDVSEHIVLLEQRVKSGAATPLFARLADHYRTMGRIEEAAMLCQEGLRQYPDYPTG